MGGGRGRGDWKNTVNQIHTSNSILIEPPDIHTCDRSTYFSGVLILNLLGFQCCPQAEGRRTGHCLVHPNIIGSVRSISVPVQLLHDTVDFSAIRNAWEALSLFQYGQYGRRVLTLPTLARTGTVRYRYRTHTSIRSGLVLVPVSYTHLTLPTMERV